MFFGSTWPKWRCGPERTRPFKKDGPTLNVLDGALDKHLQLDEGHDSVFPTTKRTLRRPWQSVVYSGFVGITRSIDENDLRSTPESIQFHTFHNQLHLTLIFTSNLSMMALNKRVQERYRFAKIQTSQPFTANVEWMIPSGKTCKTAGERRNKAIQNKYCTRKVKNITRSWILTISL